MITANDVKTALRITTDQLDDEITATINAAMLDLQSAGLAETAPQNALVDMAIKLYAKWHFDFKGKADQFQKAYFDLKNVLAITYGEDGGGG